VACNEEMKYCVKCIYEKKKEKEKKIYYSKRKINKNKKITQVKYP
jgi:hypothetical protein